MKDHPSNAFQEPLFSIGHHIDVRVALSLMEGIMNNKDVSEECHLGEIAFIQFCATAGLSREAIYKQLLIAHYYDEVEKALFEEGELAMAAMILSHFPGLKFIDESVRKKFKSLIEDLLNPEDLDIFMDQCDSLLLVNHDETIYVLEFPFDSEQVNIEVEAYQKDLLQRLFGHIVIVAKSDVFIMDAILSNRGLGLNN